jgi:site-specific recombinase XerD
MTQYVEKVFCGRMNTAYHRQSPFAAERAQYLAHLLEQGWTRNTVIGTAAKLVAVATRIDITQAGGITPEQIQAAADDWMQQPRRYRRALGPQKSATAFRRAATGWLRFLERLCEPDPTPDPYTALAADFTHFLSQECGFSTSTVKSRRSYVLAFLAWLEQQRRPLSEVSLEDVERFFASPRNASWSRLTVSSGVASLRSFLRYAGRKGWCVAHLDKGIEAPRLYTAEGLPAGPSWEQVQQLVASIGRERPADRRDRAIILLLSVYGFRSGEVCRLRLEDLDWERELIHLPQTKQLRARQCPLVAEVGEAILLYLRNARPPTERRAVFLRLLPPFAPLTVPGLGTMVQLRLKGLGFKLPHYGPHALRHACASHLLAEGLSLKEIGDHLGHSDPRSTRIYAKVNLKGLREVARLDLGGLL